LIEGTTKLPTINLTKAERLERVAAITVHTTKIW